MSKKNANQTKLCAWCGEIIVRGEKRKQSQWDDLMTCCPSCSAHWKWNKCSKENLPKQKERYCLYSQCKKPIMQKKGEHKANFERRLTCDKSCGAAHKHESSRQYYAEPVKLEKDELKRIHAKVYIPGSPEFNRIAQQYLSRGF
jgi:hypothetical protein